MSFSQSGGNFSSPQFSQAPDFQPYQHAKLNPMPEERPGLMSLLAQSLGSGLGEGVAGGIQQQLKRSALDKMLSNINPNMSPKERLLAVGSADAETQPLINDYFKQQDLQRKTQQEQEFEREKLSIQHKNKLEQQAAKPAPKSEVQKVLDQRKAGMIADTIEDIPKIESAKGDLARLRQLSKKLTGVGGYAKSLFNTESAAEFNTLGVSTIKPVLKSFNPVGAIPQQKIDMIIDKFSPKASDLATTQEGKFKTLERIAGQAERRANKLLGLIEKHGEDIPTEELLKFNRESEAMIDQYLRSEGVDVDAINAPPTQGKVKLVNPKTNEIVEIDESDPQTIAEAKAEGFE